MVKICGEILCIMLCIRKSDWICEVAGSRRALTIWVDQSIASTVSCFSEVAGFQRLALVRSHCLVVCMPTPTFVIWCQVIGPLDLGGGRT